VCEIDCDGNHKCDGSEVTLRCPAGWPCRVVCTGTQTCKDATIVCPDEHGCDVLCAGDQACQQTEISCGAASCTLTCGEHGQACDALEFRCGTADSYVQCDFDQDSEPELVPARDSTCACELDRNC